MHHAVQVVGPAIGAFAPVRQRHAVLRGELGAAAVDVIVGHVEHRHRVVRVAGFVVAHDRAETPQRALIQPPGQRRQHLPSRLVQRLAPGVVGSLEQRQAAFDQRGQRGVGSVHRHDGSCCGAAARRQFVAQIKTQVDAVRAPHAQAQRAAAGLCLERVDRVAHRRGVAPGDHEPQVVVVLALVVVVHARVRRHAGGHRLEPLRRHSERAQQRRPAGARTPGAADAADGAIAQQLPVAGDHHALFGAAAFADLGKRFANERKVALPVVQQREAQVGAQGHVHVDRGHARTPSAPRGW